MSVRHAGRCTASAVSEPACSVSAFVLTLPLFPSLFAVLLSVVLGQRVSRRDILSSSSASAASASASPAASSDSAADRSLATFTGHSVSQTLIRCDFSPGHSTGHRYAITGSSNGRLYIFDLVTGECVRQIKGHQSIVRDVAWQDDLIVSSSWDHTVRRWARRDEGGLADNAPKHAEMRSQAGRGRRMARDADDEEE